MDENSFDLIEKDYPLVSDRYKVVIVDAIVIIGLMTTYSMLIGQFNNEAPDWLRILLYSTIFLYEPISISIFSKTVGHWSGGLKVVTEKNNQKKIPLHLSIVRSVIKYVLGVISLFTITTENKGRALHDMAIGSIVLFENP